MATEIGALAVKISADVGDFIDAFNRADKATEKFSRQLDRRLSEPLAKFTATAVAAGAAVLAFAKGASDAVDEIGKMSQKVGIGVEALSGLKYAAQLSNVSLDQLGQGLKQLSKHMVENKIEGVTTEEQLLRIADEFANATDDANKTAAAMKYFGKSGADLIPLLNQGRAGIEELRKEAARLGVVFNDEAAKRANEFNDNLTRLQAAAQGLQVELAGPLVEALNKAAKAMLEAKNQGEGLFRTLIEGFRTLVTGDDAHKWNVEFTKATSNLLDAQNKLDRLKAAGGQGLGAVKDLQEAQVAVAKAQAEIDRLRAIKSVLAPDEKPAEPGKPKGKVSQDGIDERALEEVIAAGKEAMKREQEIFDARHAARVAEDARELAQIELQNAARAKAQEDGARAEIENAEIINAEFERIRREDFQAQKAKDAAEKALARERLSAASSAFGNMASLMNTSSKRMFQVGKAFALADAAVKTAGAVVDAFAWGSKVGGYWTGIAMAAAAAVAGANMMNNIRQQQFGGGGGPPTPAGQGASGVAAPVESAAPGRSSGGQTAIINITGGDTFSRSQVVELLEKINESLGDGGRIVFAR